MDTPNQPCTILRIKRKRTEEPLDALVVESPSRKKKARGGVDVFQFAQTVEHHAWEDDDLRQTLRSRISRLAQDPQASPGREIKPPSVPRADDGARRYAVKVTGDGEDHDAGQKRHPTSPPKVVSSKDIPRNDFKMYDAVLEDQGPALPPIDPQMEKFLPMLQDYLTVQDTTPSVIFNTNSSAVPNDDYVWDVFYMKALSEWNAATVNVATVTGLPPSKEDGELSDGYESEEEDDADEDSNAEEYYKNDYPDEDVDFDDDSFHECTEDEDLDSDHDWR